MLRCYHDPKQNNNPTYLKELDTDTRKHELQQSCDDHDVTDSSNSNKDTLNNMLCGRRRKKNYQHNFIWTIDHDA